MSFMDRLKKRVGKRGNEPAPPAELPRDTVAEPARTRKATAIVCQRGAGGRGCETVVLSATTLPEAVEELSAKQAELPELPWPERLVHHRAPPIPAWPPKELADVVARVPELTDAELPAYPFPITEFMRITGPAWLTSIKREVAAGAACVRARCGTLQDDLRALARILAGGGPCLVKSGSRACRKDSGHLPPHQEGEASW